MSGRGPWDHTDDSNSDDDGITSGKQHMGMNLDIETELPNVVELINGDVDYLYKLIRKGKILQFFDSVEYYIAETGIVPFDSSGKVCIGDQVGENKGDPTSLFDAAINTDATTMIPILIHYYFVKNPLPLELFTSVVKSQPLLSIISTTFPHWLEDVIVQTPYADDIQCLIGSTLSLCSCHDSSSSSLSSSHSTNNMNPSDLTTSVSSKINIDQQENINTTLLNVPNSTLDTGEVCNTIEIPTPKCLCHAQRIAVDFVHTIQPDQLVKLFKYTYKHFGCYPCNIDGFFPMAVEISEQNSKLKIDIQYRAPLVPYQQLLVQNDRCDLVQPFLSSVSAPISILPSISINDISEWNSDEQYSNFAHYFNERIKSSLKSFSDHNSNIARKSVQTSTLLSRLAQILFEACLVVDNWQHIATHYFNQLSSPAKSLQSNRYDTRHNTVTDSSSLHVSPSDDHKSNEKGTEKKELGLRASEFEEKLVSLSPLTYVDQLSHTQHSALNSFEQLLSSIIQIVQKLSRPMPLVLSTTTRTTVNGNKNTNSKKGRTKTSNTNMLETVKTISVNVYTILHQLLTLSHTDSTISRQNPLLQHIFIHFMPYLCPFHFPIVSSIIPLSLLQSFHPALFCHFNTNYNIYIHNPVMTTEYYDIMYWYHERLDDLFNVNNLNLLPQFLLPLHPLVIFASLLSTNRRTNITNKLTNIPTEFKFDSEIDLKNNFPSLDRQLLTITSSHHPIKPFIDPYMVSAQIRGSTPLHPNCLRYVIYLPRYIECIVEEDWASLSPQNQTIFNSVVSYLYHDQVPKLSNALRSNTIDFKLFQITSKNDFLYDLYRDQFKTLISSAFSSDQSVFNDFMELQICDKFLFTHPHFTMNEIWATRKSISGYFDSLVNTFNSFTDSASIDQKDVSYIKNCFNTTSLRERVWDRALECASSLRSQAKNNQTSEDDTNEDGTIEDNNIEDNN